MLKKIYLFIFSIVLFLSCSDKENNLIVPNPEVESGSDSNKEIELLPLTLVTDKDKEQIYEQVVFSLWDSLDTEPNGGFPLLLRYGDDLDSLIWQVEGSENSIHLLNTDNMRRYSLKTLWGHYFYLPGIYKTFLYGYKDGQVVVRDSAITEIFADGDFLNVNWERLDQNPNKMVRFTNDDMQDYSLQIFTSLREDVLSSRLSVRFNSFDYRNPNAEIGDREIELLTSYITALYGEAKYHITDRPFHDEFLKLFKTKFKEEQVLKIWRARKSNIALIRGTDTDVNGFGYEIHAEPIY